MLLFAFVAVGGGRCWAEDLTETISASELFGYGDVNQLSDITQYTTYSKLSFAKNNGTLAPVYEKEVIKLYKPSSGNKGCSMTITAGSAYKIVSAVFTFSDSQNFSHKFTADDGDPDATDATEETSWTGEAQSLTITNVCSSTVPKTIFIEKVVVTYKLSGLSVTKLSFNEMKENPVNLSEGSSFSGYAATVDPTGATGTITYSSSNTDVAKVDAQTGAVTLGSTFGRAVITAEFTPESDNYAESHASYTIYYTKDTSGSIFYESFDNCSGTGGNDGTWYDITGGSASITSATGWSYVTPYAASKCARFGTTTSKGSATTPALTGLSGSAILTFRAGAWNNSKEKISIKVSISGGGSLSQTSITLTKGAWTNYSILISNGTSSSKIKFEAVETNYNRFFLDEVLIMPVTSDIVTLDEAKENTISEEQASTTVSLKRTWSSEYWNTLCLPFSMTAAQVVKTFGTGTQISKFTGKNEGTKMKFESVSSIEAGVPYIIKPAITTANPIITGVTLVTTEAQTVGTGAYKFIGVYSPTDIRNKDDNNVTNMFITTSGTVLTPSSNSGNLLGMRAYISVAGANEAKAVALDLGSGVTGISMVEAATLDGGDGYIYNLRGQRVGGDKTLLPKGLYIQNGKKFIVK